MAGPEEVAPGAEGAPAEGPSSGSTRPSEDEGVEWNQEMEKEIMAEDKEAAVAEYVGHERELLDQMRAAAMAAGALLDRVTDETLMRFLRARSMDVGKASQLFVDDVKWREEYLGPAGIQPPEIESEMKANKSYVVEKEGERTWVYMYAKNHDSTTRDMHKFLRFAVFVIEKAIESLPPGEEKFGAVLDLEATQYKNLDARAILGIFETLQAHFPERLHRLYVVHVPYIFWGIWRVVKPLIDHKTRQKIRFVQDSELSQVLQDEIPPCMLPKLYGGDAELLGHWEKYAGV